MGFSKELGRIVWQVLQDLAAEYEIEGSIRVWKAISLDIEVMKSELLTFSVDRSSNDLDTLVPDIPIPKPICARDIKTSPNKEPRDEVRIAAQFEDFGAGRELRK